ncbi:MAG TPA: type II secretion system F family protein [Pirellulaceae bacterium]
MFIATLDVSTILPIAIFGLFAAGAWLVMEFFVSKKPRAEERLAELKSPRSKNADRTTGSKTSDAMARMLERTTPAFAKALQPKSEAEQSKIKLRLSYAGFRRDSAAMIFQGMKGMLLLAGIVLGGGGMFFAYGWTTTTLLRGGVVAGIAFFVPEIFLWFLIKRRQKAIFLSLPDTLDLLVVCVEAGLGLDQAMRRVVDEMSKAYPVICNEFALCNLQLQMGKSRNDVLQNLGIRTGVDDLRSLASILIQADKFGSSVARALRVQSDSMRTKRQQIAEEKAAKTAVQLIFPLVLFIFPGIFVVLVGPAAITMVREMFPMMQAAGH